MRLVPIDKTMVEIDLIYASENNFMGQKLYANDVAYLLPEAHDALMKAARTLKDKGLTLKICDAFRPTEVQELMFAHTPDTDYIASPKIGSNHSRAIAVDVTLADTNGQELDMGTAVDAFDVKSWHGNPHISAQAQKNRKSLFDAMTKAGFDYEAKEWWHYQLPNAHSYPLLGRQLAPGLLHD